MSVRKHSCCTGEVLREVRVLEPLLMLLTLLETADEREASSLPVPLLSSLLSVRTSLGVGRVIARLGHSLPDSCRTGHVHHCSGWEPGYLSLDPHLDLHRFFR